MKRLSLFLMDIGLLYLALILTLLLRYPSRFSIQYNQHIAPFLIIFAIWLLVLYIANLYNVREFRNTIHFYSNLFRAISIAAVISVAFFYLIPFFLITPKTNLAIFILVFSVLITGGRSVFNRVVETKFKKSVLFVGAGSQSLELADFIERHPALGYRVRAVVDIGKNNLGELEQIVKEGGVAAVVISPEVYANPKLIEIFYRSLGKKIAFYNLADFYERLTGRVPLSGISQIWFLENLTQGSKRVYEISKRGVDVICASILGALGLILFPFIALAIKTSSPGPIFYRQRRVGQRGQIFSMLKFRTMIRDAEQKTGAIWAAENDTRVTRVGRFLRRTRLDEIPQLWNIFRGDMSLVGPRAERPEFHEVLKNEVPFYEERYLIKPGLTGWAQINFRYGSSVKDTAEKLQYDLYYIKNRSLILDLGIILQTIRIALQQSGK